jgi:hypothetical protein
MGVLIRRHIVASLALAAVLVGGVPSHAQNASVADVSAAYIVNFVRFTTWPADVLAPGAPVVICVGGSDWVADALAQLTRNQEIDKRPLAIRRTSPDGSIDGCHVYYGSNLNGVRAERLLRTTASLPILTMSDATDFAERGGIANFFIEDGKLRFAVNPNAATRAGLHISSRLLIRARIVGS